MLEPAEISALLLSLKVATAAVLFALLPAIAIAYILAKKDFRGKILLDILVYLPLVVPPVVTGYILLILLAPTTKLGAFLDQMGIAMAFSWRGAALAAGIMAFPLMVRAFRLGFESEPPRLLLAAKSMGANTFQRFWHISLPLAIPSIFTGISLGFARALGEFGATITFVSNIEGLTRTLPLALYTATQSPDGDAPALRFAFLCLIPAVISLFVSEWLARRQRNRSGAIRVR